MFFKHTRWHHLKSILIATFSRKMLPILFQFSNALLLFLIFSIPVIVASFFKCRSLFYFSIAIIIDFHFSITAIIVTFTLIATFFFHFLLSSHCCSIFTIIQKFKVMRGLNLDFLSCSQRLDLATPHCLLNLKLVKLC